MRRLTAILFLLVFSFSSGVAIAQCWPQQASVLKTAEQSKKQKKSDNNAEEQSSEKEGEETIEASKKNYTLTSDTHENLYHRVEKYYALVSSPLISHLDFIPPSTALFLVYDVFRI